jgi:hypothetical protein
MRPIRPGALLLAAVFAPAAAAAQVPPQLPASYVAPNDDRVFVGVTEAHEAGAFLARAHGPAAAWYNMAGLARDPNSAISGSARGISIDLLAGKAPGQQALQVSSFEQLPQFVGVSLGPGVLPWESVRGGAAFTKRNSWDSLVWWSQGDSAGHWSYVSDGSFASYEVSASLAWEAAPELRFGASLGFSWTHLLENDRFSGVKALAGDAPASLRSRLLSGLVFDLAPALAVQWTPRPWLALGGLVRSPGLKLGGSATVQFEELSASAAGSTQRSMEDPAARFEYRRPLELQGGVAVLFSGWELELDVRYHASPGSYAMVSSSQPFRTTTVPPGGPATEVPFEDVRFVGRAAVNLAAGGSYAVSPAVRIHGGLYSSRSAVSGEMVQLRQVDVSGARAGLSFRGEHLSGSLGLGLEHARSSSTPDLTLPGTAPIDDAAEVSSLSGIMALEYRF